jgi:hypothetical protein
VLYTVIYYAVSSAVQSSAADHSLLASLSNVT